MGARAERLVGHLHQRRLVGGVLDHAIELGLLATFLRRLQRDRALLKPARELGMVTIKVDDPDRALTELEALLGFSLSDG